MTVIYILAALALAVALCALSGAKRPWIAQFAFAALATGSIATASKLTPIADGVYVSAAIGLYSMTFVLANFLREVYGKVAAVQAIWMGFLGELIFLFATQFTLALPSAPFWTDQNAFQTVFGATPRLMIASVIAYVCAEFTDVNLFHWVREKTQGRHLWLRNNVGTIAGQTVDTFLFYTIALYGIVPNLGQLIATTLVVKAIIAVLSTPAIYFARFTAIGKITEADVTQVDSAQ
jgi:queuosine precursor transporter